ncbi:VOC family protein [Halorarius halobius]|uniref:VOC family protein n=1 Tax=Halorarius halobius TaxID=2962671 RepID=UPI0020CF86A8|nr:VOC family protein [Halorarius halobius]
MLTDTPGIHHVSVVVRDAAAVHRLYTETLGLRCVKRTVNFEDKFTYHLYYGNEHGDPGTVLTFFPYPDEVDGRVGRPQVAATALAVPPRSLDYWEDRLSERGVAVERDERFGDALLRFSDPDGTRLELVGTDAPVDPWDEGPVPAEYAIRGIHGVSVLSVDPFQTAGLLETLGFDLEAQAGDRVRYRAPGDHATVVDLLDREAPFGREGAGSVHHVAVRAASVDELHEWRELFAERGYDVSRVKDRQFFHSLYVREPGGILFELATESPGVAAVEPLDALGERLYLPPQFEPDREMIRPQLPPLDP